MGLRFPTSKTSKARVYRGNPPVEIFGPVAVNIQKIGLMSSMPEQGLTGAGLTGQDAATHTLYLDYPKGSTYRPVLDADTIHISGTPGGIYDGYYSMKDYAEPLVSEKFKHAAGILGINARFLGAKKAGDNPNKGDNSGNLRIGPRR